ncbi:MAG: hypothetical protein ACOC9V_04810 [Chloroflexota bacterium]
MAETYSDLPCYVETVPGIEEVAWIEIRDRFPQAGFGDFLFAKDERGVVLFEHNGTLPALYDLRTIESAFLAGAHMAKISRGYRDLRQLREQMVSRGDFGRAVNALSRYRRRQITTYRLIGKKYGRHEYNRTQFRQAVIQGIEALYPQWQRVQKDADVEIWANVFGSSILIGLHLPPPRRRVAARRKGLSLIPDSLAAAMVLLTEPQDADLFLDPHCENGALLAARLASPAHLVFGGSALSPDVAGVAADPDVRAPVLHWDAGALPLAGGSVNKVATRFAPVVEGQAAARYAGWLGELQRVLRDGGLAVILTREYDLFKDVIRDFPALQIRGGYSVTVAREWGRLYLVQRKG